MDQTCWGTCWVSAALAWNMMSLANEAAIGHFLNVPEVWTTSLKTLPRAELRYPIGSWCMTSQEQMVVTPMCLHCVNLKRDSVNVWEEFESEVTNQWLIINRSSPTLQFLPGTHSTQPRSVFVLGNTAYTYVERPGFEWCSAVEVVMPNLQQIGNFH